ncbi:hypothetical protein [Fimbriimonas ginsengisoli]|uniref:Lipocalin-like domain-containing protein n=1 Tax=Fimbriimonas ginsengisoli Gsoil 348 TaxID=661478 RepID=A0A068NTJ6_FIMGI|nr:hypothetical protein [Fimbriimonas ginsengisoli]AIE86878.1 hypothetical protein OP10G_3510 [Fimbriimonas ginsengisoli Gsoil 348]
MTYRPLLPLLFAGLLSGCSALEDKKPTAQDLSKGLPGKWTVQADSYTADWTFYADGKFAYERKQNVSEAKVDGTYEQTGNTVKLMPNAVKATGPHYEADLLKSQVINPSTITLTWKGKDDFDASLTTADQTLHFRRR